MYSVLHFVSKLTFDIFHTKNEKLAKNHAIYIIPFSEFSSLVVALVRSFLTGSQFLVNSEQPQLYMKNERAKKMTKRSLNMKSIFSVHDAWYTTKRLIENARNASFNFTCYYPYRATPGTSPPLRDSGLKRSWSGGKGRGKWKIFSMCLWSRSLLVWYAGARPRENVYLL